MREERRVFQRGIDVTGAIVGVWTIWKLKNFIDKLRISAKYISNERYMSIIAWEKIQKKYTAKFIANLP